MHSFAKCRVLKPPNIRLLGQYSHAHAFVFFLDALLHFFEAVACVWMNGVICKDPAANSTLNNRQT